MMHIAVKMAAATLSGASGVSHLQYIPSLGAIQVLRNADGGGGVSDFPEKSVTKV